MADPLGRNTRRGARRVAWIGAALVVVALAGAAYYLRGEREGAQRWRTATVDTGVIRVVVSATGTLAATSTVDIGTQVSGQVAEVAVDYNDEVKAGDVLARIDPGSFQARVTQGEADLAAAQAALAEAQANAKKAERDYARTSELIRRQLIARTDEDTALAARDQARARIASAQASIAQRRAAVDDARLDLERSVIRSPVDGVVLARSVEPGQTVAASFQTPVLFRVAEDLKQMEIALSVDEADIGQVRDGQGVRFTVDALPDREFRGEITQVRLAPTNVNNVITFPVIATVANADLALLPGMTVNAEVEIARRDDVLRIPNAALRFRPAEGVAGGPGGANARGARGAMFERLPALAKDLGLDPAQRDRFDATIARMKEAYAKRQAQAQGQQPNVFGGGRGGGGGGERNGAGGGGDANRGAQLQRAFADFRQSLRPEQQQAFDAALQSMTSARSTQVYVVDARGALQPVSVQLGAADANYTEVTGGGLQDGAAVVVGVDRPTT